MSTITYRQNRKVDVRGKAAVTLSVDSKRTPPYMRIREHEGTDAVPRFFNGMKLRLVLVTGSLVGLLFALSMYICSVVF